MTDAVDRGEAGPDGLLCERCGYALEGLGFGPADCPECGLAIEQSRPERRIGTPWQRAPGVGSWLATNWAVLRRPRTTFGMAAMSGARSAGLLNLNLLVAAVVLAAGWCMHLMRLDVFIGVLPPSWWRVPISATVLAMGIGVPAAFAGLWLLTWIETRGIRFIGRRRGWRITPEVAWAVCALASVGWVVAAALASAGLVAVWGLNVQAVKQTGPTTFTIDPLRPWRAPIAGFFIGLLAFEVLVNIGVRRCRYSNSG